MSDIYVYYDGENLTGLSRINNLPGDYIVVQSEEFSTFGPDIEFYRITEGNLVPKTVVEIGAILDARETAIQNDQDRLDLIKAAQEASGLNKYTVEDVDNYMANQYDPAIYNSLLTVLNDAGDVADIKAAMIDLFENIRLTFGVCKTVDTRIAKEILK